MARPVPPPVFAAEGWVRGGGAGRFAPVAAGRPMRRVFAAEVVSVACFAAEVSGRSGARSAFSGAASSPPGWAAGCLDASADTFAAEGAALSGRASCFAAEAAPRAEAVCVFAAEVCSAPAAPGGDQRR